MPTNWRRFKSEPAALKALWNWQSSLPDGFLTGSVLWNASSRNQKSEKWTNYDVLLGVTPHLWMKLFAWLDAAPTVESENLCVARFVFVYWCMEALRIILGKTWLDGHGNWAPASVLEDEKWLLTAPFRHSACETTTFRLIVSMSCPQNHAKIPLQEGSLNCSSESSIHLRYYHVIWPEICPHVPDNDQPFSTAFCVRSFTSRK